jgi:hypothetical protein
MICHALDETSDLKFAIIFLLLMNIIFRFTHLIRSYPKRCCIDTVLEVFCGVYLHELARLAVYKFEIFAGVYRSISI